MAFRFFDGAQVEQQFTKVHKQLYKVILHVCRELNKQTCKFLVEELKVDKRFFFCEFFPAIQAIFSLDYLHNSFYHTHISLVALVSERRVPVRLQ